MPRNPRKHTEVGGSRWVGRATRTPFLLEAGPALPRSLPLAAPSRPFRALPWFPWPIPCRTGMGVRHRNDGAIFSLFSPSAPPRLCARPTADDGGPPHGVDTRVAHPLAFRSDLLAGAGRAGLGGAAGGMPAEGGVGWVVHGPGVRRWPRRWVASPAGRRQPPRGGVGPPAAVPWTCRTREPSPGATAPPGVRRGRPP